MKTANERLKVAMELAQQGRLDDGLAALAEGIVDATSRGDAPSIALLARSAGLLCAHAGRHGDAVRHYETAARAVPDDAYTEWALGGTHHDLGDATAAGAHWARFEQLAQASDDPDLLELLRLHRARHGHPE